MIENQTPRVRVSVKPRFDIYRFLLALFTLITLTSIFMEVEVHVNEDENKKDQH